MSVGATHHARNGSISTPITSPKSPSGFSLSVKKPLNRIRSKSDLPKSSGSNSGIADMWKKAGGPPVPSLPKSASALDVDDDDDDDDDLYDDADMKAASTTLIDGIKPNLDGFEEHILKLNPSLATSSNNYLIDRIAYHQVQRYKHLLNNKVKHLKYNAAGSCPSGPLCIAQGGSAKILDAKGDPRLPDPLSARYDGSDGDVTLSRGRSARRASPRTSPCLPRERCPPSSSASFASRRRSSRSRRTGQSTCTRTCNPSRAHGRNAEEPKMFKRKADWVRHENEGHRHLEWWTCDVEDRRHVCYRRDNFLQHLVREHKFNGTSIQDQGRHQEGRR